MNIKGQSRTVSTVATRSLLLAADNRNTALAERATLIARRAYSAYGHDRADGVSGRSGFNGEYREQGGFYLLGSHRGYNPVLMLFHNPDSQSPFARGGLNTYGYCLGDPVNHVDPTGNVPEWLMPALGFGLSVAGAVATFGLGAGATGIFAVLQGVSVTAGTASALTAGASLYAEYGAGDEQASSILGYVSAGLGAVSLVAGVGSGLHRFIGAGGRRASATPSQMADDAARNTLIANAPDEFPRMSKVLARAKTKSENFDEVQTGLRIRRAEWKNPLSKRQPLVEAPPSVAASSDSFTVASGWPPGRSGTRAISPSARSNREIRNGAKH